MSMTPGSIHVSSDYEKELDDLRSMLLDMGGRVEFMAAKSIQGLVENDAQTSQGAIDKEEEVDRLEEDINEICIRMLARRQPTAGDLRFITTGMKIASDLERIADLSVNISERALELLEEPPLKPYVELPRMAALCRRMLKASLDSFLGEDTAMARDVIRSDDEVDDINEGLFRELLTYMMEDPRTIGRATRLTFISKYLERMADHATNIAEAVIFMVEGSHPSKKSQKSDQAQGNH
ncbi:MAG: phosphate signaling complex protein PhoU [Acidobacteriota bacterium]